MSRSFLANITESSSKASRAQACVETRTGQETKSSQLAEVSEVNNGKQKTFFLITSGPSWQCCQLKWLFWRGFSMPPFPTPCKRNILIWNQLKSLTMIIKIKMTNKKKTVDKRYVATSRPFKVPHEWNGDAKRPGCVQTRPKICHVPSAEKWIVRRRARCPRK